ncbi:putative cytochrome P450 6a13 isoform X1 [Rhynchophorus ferrugineus]|uniref:putative cytochrome P450 6a13 isoform X1 n=1 Tax=Rhynchophorus ferrugineus TaxID=354439 RepID=UPI003FCE56B5
MFISSILVLLCLVAFYVKWRYNYWNRRGLYQPKPQFPFGNFKSELTREKSFFDGNFELYQRLKGSGHKHAGVYLFLEPVYLPVDLSIIKRILFNDFSHFMNRGVYHHPKDVLTMNLFSMEGEQWRALRAKLTPTFTSGKLKSMFPILQANINVLDRVVGHNSVNKTPVDIKDVASRLTTDNIASCAFGLECNSLEEQENSFRTYGRKMFEPQPLKMFMIEFLPTWLLGSLGFKAQRPDVEHFFSTTVKDTIKLREENNLMRNDFLQLLLEMKKDQTLTVDEITAQCIIFFLGGFETSASAITFTLLELSRNPGIQNKVKQEISEILKEFNDEITYDSLMRMKYLDMVINETLRLYPPLPVLPRICSKTYRVPGTEVVIQKGTRVNIPVWGIHKDPEYYPDPEKFNPENFTEQNKADRPDTTFLPFGEGPRMCIAMRFGLLQTKLAIASLLKRYRFTLNENTHIPIKMRNDTFVLMAEDDIWLNVCEE